MEIENYQDKLVTTLNDALKEAVGEFTKIIDEQQLRMFIARELLDYAFPIEEGKLDEIAEILGLKG